MAFEEMDKLILYPDFMSNGLKDKAFPKQYNTKTNSSKSEKPKVEEAKVEEVTPQPQLKDRKDLGMFEFQTKIVWFNAIGFLAMHIAGLYGLWISICEIGNLQLGTSLWTILLIFLGGEGITIGAHRLWTHRSYKAKPILQIILITLQTLAGQNCCYIWARDHRQHHKYSDTDADPHNASRGFFFSHIGWLMMKKHPEVIRKGKGIDMSDLEANPIIMFQKKWYNPLYVIFAMCIPIFTPVYFWNESLWNSFFITFFTRYIIQLNITWCVNSVAHMFGTRPYDKNILPVESTFVSFIGLGEGWHNYHHAFPWDYKASEFGMHLNGTTRLIEMFAKIGWAYDLREASRNVMVSRIERSGDGTHPVYSAQNYCKELEEEVVKEYESKHLGREIEDEREVEVEHLVQSETCEDDCNHNYEEPDPSPIVKNEIKDVKQVCDNKLSKNRNNNVRNRRQLLRHG